MASFDLQKLIAPVSEDESCGPDLDLAGDSEYMNFVAGAEGRLPSSYFDGRDDSGAIGRPFQFSKTDLEGVYSAATPLLAKTRDLRLLFLLSKFALLGRQFEDFSTLIQAAAALLNDRWDEVHPRGEAGEFQARMVAVESIDVQPTVIMPLQFLPLIEHRRFGMTTYRGHLIATGAALPRENEEVTEQTTIDRLIREVELPELIARRGEFIVLKAALAAICQTWSDKDGSGGTVSLNMIIELVDKIVAFVDSAVTLRDPAAGLSATDVDQAGDGAAEGADGEGATSAWRVTNQAEAGAALTAVAYYLSKNEPSSPTLPLVRQANLLLGKSFIDVMRTLVPTHFEQAAIEIGRTESFSLPIERLASLTGEGGGAAGGEGDDAAPGEGDDAAAGEGDGAAAGESDGAAGERDDAGAGEGDGAAAGEPSPFEQAPQAAIRSRSQALSVLDQVAAYFRAAEPSSPIPFIIERARDLAQRDFLSVLKALLPADTLNGSSSGNLKGSSSES